MSTFTRICLIVTILAALGAIGGGLRLKSVRARLQTDLSQKTSEAEQKEKDLEAEKTAKAEAIAKFNDQSKKLNEVQGEAEKTKSDLDSLKTQTHAMEEKLSKVQEDLGAKQQEIEKFTKALPEGMTIDQVKDRLKEFQDQFATMDQEKKILNDQLVKMEADKKKLEEQAQRRKDGKMPAGLTGHVISVNVDWNFVVLDIGANQGVVENVPMIVYRDGNLIGKVKITSVEPSISIADILPDWQQGPLMEGDTVTF